MQMPTEPTYHNNLGLSYFESGNFESALGSYEEAIRLEKEKFKTEKDRSHENLSFYHKNLGLALYHQGQMDRALIEYQEAIVNNPNNADKVGRAGQCQV